MGGEDGTGLIVQKYGVTTRDVRSIMGVCRRLAGTARRGRRVVAVISAMGHDTDRLIELAYRVKGGAPRPAARELDMLMASGETITAPLVAMGLNGMGVPAVALSGLQAGIWTSGEHAQARITAVRPDRVLRALDAGQVAVVAGFQGVSEDLEVTTLGRGGADATAVTLAGELGAEVCEIYAADDGILSADRRLVREARVVRHVSYEEALELAAMGRRVIQPRALEMAAMLGTPIHLRSAHRQGPGTLIVDRVPERERREVCAVACQERVARVRVRGLPNRPGAAAGVFEPLRRDGVSVDVIAHVAGGDLAFVVRQADLERALAAVEPAARALGGGVGHESDLVEVSIVGAGMRGRAGVAARMFRALADAGVTVDLIATSEIRVTCVVRRQGHERAVQALHEAFELGRRPDPSPGRGPGPPPRETRAGFRRASGPG